MRIMGSMLAMPLFLLARAGVKFLPMCRDVQSDWKSFFGKWLDPRWWMPVIRGSCSLAYPSRTQPQVFEVFPGFHPFLRAQDDEFNQESSSLSKR